MRISLIVTATLLIAAITLGVLAKSQGNPKSIGPSPAGTWQAVEAELGGKPLPLEVVRTIKLVLSETEYQVGNDLGTVDIDSAASPGAITIRGTKGPNQGKTILAIYELTGDTLRICYDLTGKIRPTAFATELGTRQFLVRYKKDEAK